LQASRYNQVISVYQAMGGGWVDIADSHTPVSLSADRKGNASQDSAHTVERSVDAGSVATHVRPLGIDYPPDIFSLSHVAI
ncbi:hypothetical protein AB4Y44_42985, partial [Paraburkholderia sp. BR10937]